MEPPQNQFLEPPENQFLEPPPENYGRKDQRNHSIGSNGAGRKRSKEPPVDEPSSPTPSGGKSGKSVSKPSNEKETERLRAMMAKSASSESTLTLKPVTPPLIKCDEYLVELHRPMAGQFGLVYRAISSPGRPHLFVMQVLPGCAADIWNQWADPDTNRIRAGDLIISVNGKTELELMLDCLRNDKIVNMQLMKGACYAQRCPDGTWGIYEYDSKIFTRDASLHFSKSSTSEDNAALLPAFGDSAITPGGLLALFSACAMPAAILLLFFSDVGFGISIYIFLIPQNMLGNALVSLGFLLLMLFYILDFSQWSKRLKVFFGVLVVYMLFFGGILKSSFYPQVPVIILLFHTPILLGIIRMTVCRKTSKADFYVYTSIGCISTAVVVLVVWMCWIFVESFDGNNQWNDMTKARLISDSAEMYAAWDVKYDRDCNPDTRSEVDEAGQPLSDEDKTYRKYACAKAATTWYLVYVSPCICAGILMVIGLICFFRGVYVHESTNTTRVENVLKHFGILFAVLLSGMWISASIAGAAMQLSGTLMGFMGGGLIGLSVWCYCEIGPMNMYHSARNNKMVRGMIKLCISDWGRAFLILCWMCFIIPVLMLSALNQSMRRYRGFSKSNAWFTDNVQHRMDQMQTWNWAGIIQKLNWLAILYFVIMVGFAKVTYIFLSALNEALLEIPFAGVLVIFFLVGISMFLLPPVPGVPVYVTGGIVLAARADVSGEAGGYWGGIVIGIFLCFFLKLCAVAGQWSIGMQLGKSVSVQKFVGVDKVSIRAIEDILKYPGLSLPKVSILVGGPDWPTSVLCGILKLNLLSCILGTTPCIFISTPCVLAGAFLYRASEGIWESIAGVTLVVSSLLQIMSMLSAMYFTAQVVSKKSDELKKPRPEHKPIEELTQAGLRLEQVRGQITEWSVLPKAQRFTLGSSGFLFGVSWFILVFSDKSCFRRFQLTSRIDDPYIETGLAGNPFNIVKELGVVALAMFFLGSVQFWRYCRWENKASKTALAHDILKEENGENDIQGHEDPHKVSKDRSSASSKETKESNKDSKDRSSGKETKSSRNESKDSKARRRDSSKGKQPDNGKGTSLTLMTPLPPPA